MNGYNFLIYLEKQEWGVVQIHPILKWVGTVVQLLSNRLRWFPHSRVTMNILESIEH